VGSSTGEGLYAILHEFHSNAKLCRTLMRAALRV